MTNVIDLRGLRLALAAACAAPLAFGAALAADAGFVGHTIVSETPSYGSLSFYVAEDGTYKGSNGDTGSWTFDGETLCFDDFCGAFDGSKGPGDAWEGVDWGTGEAAQLHIEEGDAI